MPSNKLAYNLDVNLNFNKILSSLYFAGFRRQTYSNKFSIFWFNSHKPAQNVFFHRVNLIPSLAPTESEGIYFNLEERPQYSHQFSTYFLPSLKDRFFPNLCSKNLKEEFFFFTKNRSFLVSNSLKFISKINDTPEFNFIYELVNTPKLFEEPRKCLVDLFNRIFPTNYGSCLKYTCKPNLIDIYTMNSYLKNSPRMGECSRELRKLSNNFL